MLLSILAVVSNVAMLYSEAPADRAAMLAHAGRFANGLFLLFTLTQMGSIDTARRMRAERDLTRLNEALEDRVRARTADLEAANSALRAEAATRELAEPRHSRNSAACGSCSKQPTPSPNGRISPAFSRWW